MRRALILAIAILAACTTATAPPARPLFAFHDNFWLNLHLFTRVVARGEPAPGNLQADERAAWDTAVAMYRDKYAKRDLLFDDGMIAIERELVRLEGKDSIEGAALDPELKSTLMRIAPVYRKYWWPAHQASNEKWIAAVRPLIDKYGPELSARVASAYGVEWPAEPIPVDVTITAGANNAYTMPPPVHTTIASTEPTLQGYASLELLFHEPSHQWGTLLINSIPHAAERYHKKVPRQLWHAVLFYNAGELTRRVLQQHGIAYEEYAQKYKIYRDLCGDGCRDRIAAAWNRRLDGTASVDEALDALVSSWPDN